jgi:hypothetical protein
LRPCRFSSRPHAKQTLDCIARIDPDGVGPDGKHAVKTRHGLSAREIEIILAGGIINWRRHQRPAARRSG